MESPSSTGQPRAMTQATCSSCGQTTTVPFVPTPGRPVFCRECFAKKNGGPAPQGNRQPPRRFGNAPNGAGAPPRQNVPGARKRMMAQGRKGHFMFDAKAIMRAQEGGMDDQHHRAFLEGLFARGARTSTEAARDFLDEKLADNTITQDEHRGLSQLVERYSFWR